MKTFVRLLAIIVTMLIISAGMAIANGIGTFYVNTEAYHGPSHADPNGIIKVSCYNNANWWVYESDHFLVYCDRSSDPNCSKFAGMAETEFASVKATLGVTDEELGISTTGPSTKPHLCSDWNSNDGASGDSSGISMPALDESNAKMDPLDRLHDFAGYRNTIRHEMTHLFQSKLSDDLLSIPVSKLELWFVEGMAVYIAHHGGLLDTLSLGDYFAAGRPNPVTVKQRTNMGSWTNKNLYPAFGLAFKYLLDSTARGGAGNSMSSTKDIFNKIRSGKSFPVAFGETFTRAGAPLTLADYTTNFQSWMNPYLSNLETPGAVTGASGISYVGIFLNYKGCDMISGLGATVTSSGAFTLNVSELANGSYALCFMGDNFSNIYGPAMVTVSGGKLSPTSYNISLWPSSCLALSPPSRSLSYSGSTGNIGVISVSDSCSSWTATSNDSWITITSGSSWAGTGTVTYSVAANSGAARTGTIIIGGQTFTVTQEPGSTSIIPLSAGWNFISFPNLPTSATVATVFTDVSSNTRIIWGYNNSTKVWKKYKPGSTDNSLSTIEGGKGYWAYMDASGNIDISGWDTQSKTVPLFEGWNLIGYNGTDSKTFGESYISSSGLADKWIVIWTWDNGQWYAKHAFVTELPVLPLSILNQGRAYWIKIKEGQTADWNQ